MNLKKWNKEHTIGLLLGIVTTIVAIPVVIMILSAMDDIPFSRMWNNFMYFPNEKARIISLASIANLGWFHYLMKKQNWNRGMGIILATILGLLMMSYFKFFA